MESFRSQFERYLLLDSEGPEASRLIDKVVRRGFARDFIISALESAINPTKDKVLRHLAKKTLMRSSPTRKQVLALSARLENLANDLGATFDKPILKAGTQSGVDHVLALVATLHHEARRLRRFPIPRLGKFFSYRAFFAQIPIFFLCKVFNATGSKYAVMALKMNLQDVGEINYSNPKWGVVTFPELEYLLYYAQRARGKTETSATIPEGSLRRRYNRFIKTFQGALFLAVLRNWPTLVRDNEKGW